MIELQLWQIINQKFRIQLVKIKETMKIQMELKEMK